MSEVTNLVDGIESVEPQGEGDWLFTTDSLLTVQIEHAAKAR